MSQQFHFWILSEENENTNLKRYIYPQRFTAILLETTKTTAAPPRVPTDGAWVKRLWGVYSGYYSAIRKNEILPFVRTWKGIGVVLRGANQTQKTILFGLSYA